VNVERQTSWFVTHGYGGVGRNGLDEIVEPVGVNINRDERRVHQSCGERAWTP
jgi:hypothetical protein